VKIIEKNNFDTSRLQRMGSRKLRRKLQRKDFRPVYNHGIPTDAPHKDIIRAMKSKNRKATKRWAEHMNMVQGLVAWGVALQYVEHAQKIASMKARHEALKAEGNWIERGIIFPY
jgi:hypothetical protein